nr:hypothetical protein Iba_chr14aCG19020 [Ipomoea batatas]
MDEEWQLCWHEEQPELEECLSLNGPSSANAPPPIEEQPGPAANRKRKEKVKKTETLAIAAANTDIGTSINPI